MKIALFSAIPAHLPAPEACMQSMELQKPDAEKAMGKISIAYTNFRGNRKHKAC